MYRVSHYDFPIFIHILVEKSNREMDILYCSFIEIKNMFTGYSDIIAINV